jgi:hypothetical protein
MTASAVVLAGLGKLPTTHCSGAVVVLQASLLKDPSCLDAAKLAAITGVLG